MTSVSVATLLAAERFDIVHLVMAVDPDSGNLIFTPLDTTTHAPIGRELDTMSPEAFADLIVESHTRLVNLATCHALFLAAEVARVCNMIATNAMVDGEAAARWRDIFYRFIASGIPLYKAAELTRRQSQIPLRLIRYRDVVFQLEQSAEL